GCIHTPSCSAKSPCGTRGAVPGSPCFAGLGKAAFCEALRAATSAAGENRKPRPSDNNDLLEYSRNFRRIIFPLDLADFHSLTSKHSFGFPRRQAYFRLFVS